MESKEILQQFVDINRKAKNGGSITPTKINQYGLYIFAPLLFQNTIFK